MPLLCRIATSADTFDTYARIARHAALNDRSALLAALRALRGAPDEMAVVMRRHQLADLVRLALDPEDMRDAPWADAIDRARAAHRLDPAASLALFDELRSALEASGIAVMLLKGAVLGDRLYGGSHRRPQHDLDILVHRSDARRARRMLAGLGFRRSGRDLHAVEVSRRGVKVDIHRALRRTPAYAPDEQMVWDTAREVEIGGRRVLTPSDEYTVTMLATSIVEDVGFCMAKLKQVLDLYLLAREVDGTADWEAWLDRRRPEGLEATTANGCALAISVLDAIDEVPNLAGALVRRGPLVRVRDHAHALVLIASRSESDNMAWLRQVYPGSLLRWGATQWVVRLPTSLGDLRPSRLRRQLARYHTSQNRSTDATPDDTGNPASTG